MNRALIDGPTPDCLDLDTLGALADGSIDPALRVEVLPHLAACGHCRGTVASVSRILTDPEVARELRAAGAPARRVWLRIAVPAAAAAVLLLMLRPGDRADRPADDLHRAPTIANGSLPTSLAPVGNVAEASSLRWRAVPGADRYRVTLFDTEGRVVYASETTEPTTALPDSVRLTQERRYLWKVEARVGFDRWVSSELVEFSLIRGAPP